ncbi:MATE family efflux transporter [Rubellimicrobium sp. CFH 75288]|uniref:MATE family efflux transporter n=1 Tax=Rubellimicrobium sp. CFH 75288 TaxID=2697034 RepID=UPI0014131EE6|nr:MATE family efflux transporter [Rubellimicrobium sp. CFH 75288]NAZ35926.1 MATE family efflux transporter [Rubellimicrobium sp. CFH 75288]
MTSTLAPDRAPAVGFGGHARALMGLAGPLILSNLAGFAIGITDIVLMGWYDVVGLAGMVLAHSLFFIVFLTGSGFAIAVMPLVATAAIEGREGDVRRVTRMGLWLSLGYCALAIPVLLLAEPFFLLIGQDPAVAAEAGLYLRIGGWALLPALVIAVMRSFLSALERTSVLLWVTVAMAVLNAIWAYALIFGAWGLPRMGIAGAGWAALLTNLAGAVALLAYGVWRLPHYRLLQRLWRPDWPILLRVARIGWPIGGQLLAEVGLFASSAAMVGWIGPVQLAAHGIAMQLASLAFMVHLGLSQAATVRTGQAVGRSDRVGMRQGAVAAVTLSGAFALLTSALFLLWPRDLIGLFVRPDDPARAEVIAVGAMLLAFAALFQLFDGAQIVAMGLLRGIQDTAIPLAIAALSYWGIGLTAAYVLGFVADLAEIGVWLGLVIGLVAASVLLLLRFAALSRLPEGRV